MVGSGMEFEGNRAKAKKIGMDLATTRGGQKTNGITTTTRYRK